MINEASRQRIEQSILSAMGPLVRDLMGDDRVIEIMLNPDGSLWAERLGQGMEKIRQRDTGCAAETLIRLVSSQMEGECNAERPLLSAMLPMFKARFEAALPPIVDGPAFAIRKPALKVFSIDEYVESGVLTQKHADLLKAAVKNRKNILIVGGTGSGKTTFANALLKEMALSQDRILTIEDTPELQCEAPNVWRYYTNADIDFSMQKAVKSALRLRPDRIVVGEVRDGSALDLLKAWNTGHSGGLATIHANSASLGLERLESLILEVSANVPRRLIAEAVNVVINIVKTADGRKINELLELSGGALENTSAKNG